MSSQSTTNRTYTVGEMAKLAGITIRSLHHYEDKGLLVPQRSSNGYRCYSSAEVERLQLILLYRQMGMSLDQIKQTLDANQASTLDLLYSHLEDLATKRTALDMLIASVKRTIAAMEGVDTMTDQERFEALKAQRIAQNEETYGAEARKRWGDETIDASNQKVSDMSIEEFATLEEVEQALHTEVVAGVTDGDADGSHAAKAAALHAQWLQYYWPEGIYSPETHVALAQGYLQDERFKAYYDAWVEGGTQFLVNAIESNIK